MAGEAQKQDSGWTIETLKAFHDQALRYQTKLANERDIRYKERWAAQEAASKYNQEKSNEFRGALDDLSTKMETKSEAGVAHNSLSEKIDELNKLLGELRSRLDVGNPAIGTIQQQLAANAGVQKGSDITMAKIVTAITLTGTVLGIIVIIANMVFK